MKKLTINLTFTTVMVMCCSSILRAQDATSAHKDSLDAIVTAYYELNLKIFQANSTVADIDKAFALFTDDFTYVHPRYGGTYSRQDLYDGYINNQQSGAYNGSVTDIEVINKIIGLNAVTTQKRFIENKNGTLKKGEPEMTVFEFRDGKISRIYEYW